MKSLSQHLNEALNEDSKRVKHISKVKKGDVAIDHHGDTWKVKDIVVGDKEKAIKKFGTKLMKEIENYDIDNGSSFILVTAPEGESSFDDVVYPYDPEKDGNYGAKVYYT